MGYLLLTFALVGLDQLIKIWVRASLSADDLVEVIPNLIHLTYQENRGISFSLFSQMPESLRQPSLAGISALVIMGLSGYLVRQWSQLDPLEKLGFHLILAGALGNLIDRTFRGSVTDYMYFHFYQTSFFVNNLADDLISIGFVVVLLHSFRNRHGR